MKFLFVDKVDEVAPGTVRGRVRFHARSPFRRRAPDGSWRIPAGVVGEAMGQLVSWGLMERQDFRYRPIYLFSERLEAFAAAAPGDEVELTGTIGRLTDESVVFSATASVQGREIQRLTHCTNYFMPLERLEDPAETRATFAALTSPAGRPLDDEGEAHDFGAYLHRYETKASGRGAVAEACIAADAAFYADHFPREPVTPIVVINEVIESATFRLFAAHGHKAQRLARAEAIKIKSFIRPGETFTVDLDLDAAAPADGGLGVRARVAKDGKEILRGRYHFCEA